MSVYITDIGYTLMIVDYKTLSALTIFMDHIQRNLYLNRPTSGLM